MPHIQDKDIHPQLRAAGRFIRFVLPYFTKWTFRIYNLFISGLKGKPCKGLGYEQIYVPRRDGTKLRMCVYTPLQKQDNVPGLLWIHGGGFAVGLPEEGTDFISRFIATSGCVVVAPDYTLSLEKAYPAALDDCYLALLWLRDNGNNYGMRSDQIIVAGDSAGGGLTVSICLMARDKNEVSIAYQIPIYPMLDDRMSSDSMVNNDAPNWNMKSNEAAWKTYLGDLYRTDDVPVYAAPGRAQDLSGLPPACSFIGSIDPFYDETLQYFDKLRERGIPVRLKTFAGCFHAFQQMVPNAALSKDAYQFVTDTFSEAVLQYFAQQPEI